jgi:tetratricopeptide (TPR) repeat protein
MNSASIDSNEFIRIVRPALETSDPHQLAQTVSERWSAEDLCHLLRQGTLDARRVVCLTLGLVGDSDCVACLAAALRDRDDQVGELAEHALWSIWFRTGSAAAMPHFKRGVKAMDANHMSDAVVHFHEAVRLDPKFAEAFNQCAIAHYMLEEWSEALQDCLAVVDVIPLHFGAQSGMGHCYAQMGDMPAAARCYEHALTINPRMPAIASALSRIRSRISC